MFDSTDIDQIARSLAGAEAASASFHHQHSAGFAGFDAMMAASRAQFQQLAYDLSQDAVSQPAIDSSQAQQAVQDVRSAVAALREEVVTATVLRSIDTDAAAQSLSALRQPLTLPPPTITPPAIPRVVLPPQDPASGQAPPSLPPPPAWPPDLSAFTSQAQAAIAQLGENVSAAARSQVFPQPYPPVVPTPSAIGNPADWSMGGLDIAGRWNTPAGATGPWPDLVPSTVAPGQSPHRNPDGTEHLTRQQHTAAQAAADHAHAVAPHADVARDDAASLAQSHPGAYASSRGAGESGESYYKQLQQMTTMLRNTPDTANGTALNGMAYGTAFGNTIAGQLRDQPGGQWTPETWNQAQLGQQQKLDEIANKLGSINHTLAARQQVELKLDNGSTLRGYITSTLGSYIASQVAGGGG